MHIGHAAAATLPAGNMRVEVIKLKRCMPLNSFRVTAAARLLLTPQNTVAGNRVAKNEAEKRVRREMG